ncbi:MAG: hypothetical protein OSB44_09485 [Verrucomicrobiales bacterium]|nr:hypothetical protein [Verrucomicrobiales bacterium]
MKISLNAYVITGTAALLAILIYSYVPINSIPIDPKENTSQLNQSKLEVAKTEKAILEKSTASQISKNNPLIAKKEPEPSNTDKENKLPSTPKNQEPKLTRKQLTARALVVEKQANKRLDELTEKLNLTEEQQDFIFPILAKSLPTFHPSLNPDGNNLLSGIKTRVEPGSSVPDVEAEIYSILDEDQKIILEEEALDREAWWNDVVALLDEESTKNLEETTPNTEKPQTSVENGNEPVSQKERGEKAAKNKIDDFSRLLRNN